MARKRTASVQSPSWATDPQYLAFERDLISNPDDDTPRLVLADWLEDHGDEHTAARAEFIRLQIQLSKLSRNDPLRRSLERRERELLQSHQTAWLGPLAEFVTEAVWQRGFPQRLKLGVRQFIDHADLIFRHAPILHLQLLRVSQTKMTMEELAACPHFSRLRGLSLPSSSIGDAKLSVLLQRGDFRNLEMLDLSGATLGREALRSLAQADLPRLQQLDLTGNWVQGGFAALLTAKVGFRLRELRLGSCALNESDLGALVVWPGIEDLETLVLAGNPLGNAGGTLLAESAHLRSLLRLDLGMCEIGARGVQAFARTQAFPKLCEIDLTLNSIRPSGFAALLQCDFAANLEAFRLNHNYLGDGSLKRLAEWPGLAGIRRLELRSNQLTSVGVCALMESPYLQSLEVLSLADNAVEDDAICVMARSPRLASLRQLDLAFTQMRDQGGEALLASPSLQSLERLTLSSLLVSRDCARKILARFPNAFTGAFA